MHQRSSFWPQKSKKFLGRGYSPLPRLLPQWGGGHPLPTPYPHTLPPSAPSVPLSSRLRRSKLAHSALDTSDSRLRRPVPPAFPVSPPNLGVLAETLDVNEQRIIAFLTEKCCYLNLRSKVRTQLKWGVVCRPVSTLKADILNITYDCYSQNNNVKNGNTVNLIIW